MAGTSYITPLLPILVLLLLYSCGSGEPAVADDIETLLAIKKASGNPRQLADWNPAVADHCRWRGVTCDETDGGSAGGVVVALSLPSMNLNGSVPKSVCALKKLTRLDLSFSNLAGAFPATTLYA